MALAGVMTVSAEEIHIALEGFYQIAVHMRENRMGTLHAGTLESRTSIQSNIYT